MESWTLEFSIALLAISAPVTAAVFGAVTSRGEKVSVREFLLLAASMEALKHDVAEIKRVIKEGR